jgi:urea transport system substrate-binding protein
MSTDPWMSQLMARWREARSQGLDPDISEICRERPELEEQFRRLISAQTQSSHNADTFPTTTFPPVRISDPGSASDLPLAPPQGPDELGRLGDFRMLRILGRGGMGIVYEGEDVNLHRQVAVKVLNPALSDENGRERFIREARAVAAIKDSYVVTVHQVGREGDTPYMVMEYLEGETLNDRLAREHVLPLAEAARIAREVALGLAAAHAKDLIHRDVKPANIWLGKDGGHVKLLDFGLVRPQSNTAKQLTGHGAIVGTLGYMAPEQICAGPMDGRTDLYGLGCALYRMLTGELPYDASNTMALLEKVVNREPVQLDAIARKLPEPVADLLRRLLARNPNDRPATATDVVESLVRIEKSLAGHFQPTTLSAAPPRPKSHRWGIIIGAAVIVLACVVGAATEYHRLFHASNDKSGNSANARTVLDETNPIRIGVLHSRTGSTRDSERPMYDAIVLAVNEINHTGGVLGRKVEVVARDTASDDDIYPKMAEDLIANEKVTVLFGGWSCAGRKLLGEVCKKHDQLLIYSPLGEGLEEHPNIVYAGGAPNQQLREAANWTRTHLRKRKAFLIGSEFDLYSHAGFEMLKAEFQELGIELVKERYISAGGEDLNKLANEIKESGADVVFNLLDGPDNVSYFRAMRRAKISSAEVPTVWLGVGEDELSVLDLRDAIGDVLVTPYLQSLPNKENKEFIQRYEARYPSHSRISDATAVSYSAVYLWKQAVEKTKSTDALQVREGFRGQAFVGPEGPIKIDPKNLYAWRKPRLGRMNDKLVFEVVRGAEMWVEPIPFPASHTRQEWEAFLNRLYTSWGDRWNQPTETMKREDAK